MDETIKKRNKRNLIIFIILVVGLSIIAGCIEPLTVPPDAGTDAAGLGQLVWLVAPLAAAAVLRSFAGEGWADFGLRPNFKGNGFWWLVSLLVFPAVFALIMLAGRLFGGLQIDQNLTTTFVSGIAAALVPALIKNVFEEFAWRGYLAPKVYALDLNIWLSHAIVGIVWGAWHLPFIFALWPYLTNEMLWYFIPLLFIGTFSQSVVYGEIRLATNSVLPAWLMHTLANAVGNTLILSGFIKFNSGAELWFSPGVESLLSITLMFGIGFWLHQRRKKVNPTG